METEKTIVQLAVKILGKEYTVGCPEGQEHALLNAAKRIDNEMRKIRESGKVLGTDRIAVMVALNLAHELAKLQQQLTQPALAALAPSVEEVGVVTQLQKLQGDIANALAQYQRPPNTPSN